MAIFDANTRPVEDVPSSTCRHIDANKPVYFFEPWFVVKFATIVQTVA
jgi:hypothetical protein